MGFDAVAASPETARRRFRIAVAISVCIAGVEFVWELEKLGGAKATMAFSDIIDIPVLVVVSALCLIAARRPNGPARLGWKLLAAGMSAWCVGQMIWTFYELFLGRDVPFPSFADVGYLLLIPFTAAAMLVFPTAPKARNARGRVLLDGVIIAATLLGISWATVLGDAYRGGAESALARILGLAYPVGDTIIIGVVIFVAARASRRERAKVALIGAGLVAIAISDSLFAYLTAHKLYSSGAVIDVGWTIGFLLVGLGALRPPANRSEADSPTTRLGAVLPYVGLLFAVPIAVAQFITNRLDPVTFWCGLVVIVAIAIRQLLTVLEHRDLATRFEQRVEERTAELNQALADLSEAMRRQDEFVSNASHELFTPLTTIVGATDLLLEPDTIPWHEASSMVSLVGKAAKRMTHLVDDLLLASGLTGYVSCARDPFDVNAQLQKALDSFHPTDNEVEVRVVRGVVAAGDSERLETALGHVLDNAHKFSPAGSAITVSMQAATDTVSIVVHNDGAGIPSSLRESVFDRYFQADMSDSRRHGGLGLGLFLSRQLLRAMGGDVTIDDVLSGCSIRITLPLADAASSDEPDRTKIATSGVRRTFG